ncbi:SGNH/GDSL hydrolase family protein [Anianabacter salinae]|uniref:SGNH/GDSL hydrolase family protein n=1 Tax=Anianabacter salinae TaxID=2851023 RepID=UPI00225E1530|nr:SGNH/GDSL hydrolase family protein [Anianabacter salinae]MBV0910823.1 SGNH/GDSL hydrolase family protein [Anianabacter salinae]
MPRLILMIALVLTALVSCARTTGGGQPSVLAIGDSVMAWNRDKSASIPDVVARATGRTVLNASVPGQGLTREGSLFPGTIGGQLRRGSWDWIIANGGANDLNRICNCSRCDAEIDRLISVDGSGGLWPGLVQQMKAAGGRNILIMGYYGPAQGGGGAFAKCSDEVAELDRRFARLAAADPRVTHVLTRDPFGGARALYDDDLIHPSLRGSEVLGQLLARTVGAGG